MFKLQARYKTCFLSFVLAAFVYGTQANAALVDLRGATPESKTMTIDLSKPAGATSGEIMLATYDADNADEGELIINGNAPVKLFDSSGASANNQKSADVVISTPASYWKNGANTLVFRHTRTHGYVIDDIDVTFETGSIDDVDVTFETGDSGDDSGQEPLSVAPTNDQNIVSSDTKSQYIQIGWPVSAD